MAGEDISKANMPTGGNDAMEYWTVHGPEAEPAQPEEDEEVSPEPIPPRGPEDIVRYYGPGV